MSTAAVKALPSHTYDAGQLAKILGVSRNTLLWWARSGIIPPGRRFGARVLRWTPGDIAPFLAERRMTNA
jgi:hypothetical protein